MNALKISNGLILDFALNGAGGSDAFLLAATDGTVKSLASVPVARVSGGGNLTETTSSVLTITGGSSAVLTSGLTIQVKLAATGQSGYLSSTDWNTFNGKLGTSLTSANVFVGNGSNVATGVSITGDIEITNAGITSISSGVIVNADVNASAAIALSKLAPLSTNLVTATNGSGFITTVAGFTTTITGYLTGITSAVQTQIDGKLSVTLTSPASGDVITYNGSAWINSATGSGTLPIGGTANQFLTKINSTNYNTQWHTLIAADISDVTSTAAQLNLLTGVTTTNAQFNYLNTSTSDIQVQLNNKLSSSLSFNSIFVGNNLGIASAVAAGTEGYVLTISGGSPVWAINASATPLTTKGDLYTYSTLNTRLGVGTNNQLLVADSAQTTGLKWVAVDLSTSMVTGNLGVSHLNSGTSASSSTFWRGDGTWTAVSGAISGLTATRIPYASGASTLADDAALIWNTPYISLGYSTNKRNIDIGKYQNQGLNLYMTKTATGGAFTKFIIEAATGISGDANGDDILIRSGGGFASGNGTPGNISILTGTPTGSGTESGVNIQFRSTGLLGFFAATAVVKQTSGANITNNVTSGGTTDQIDDFTSLTIYATDAAAIRNDIYQLARKIKQINDGLRTYGLFT